ncbi:MAG: L,D-transpeptidase family protein [Blastocatellia bacterium]|nr:L,D-transpeptidase family protein [Blastocatellia bacterium]
MSRGREQDGMGGAIIRRLSLLVLLGLISPASSQTPAPVVRPQGGQEATARRKEPPMSEEEIREARALLTERGYWVLTEATGLDASLRHALIAYQKIEGRARTGILTREELEALRASGTPAPLESGYAHVEVDLKRQVLFFVPESEAPARILPVSSGSGEWFTEGGRTRRALTPTGRFKVVRKIEGWRKSPLGLLHYPNYIYDGIAIHGNPAVPPTPASHGCIRIPMSAAKEFSALAVVDLPVIVYDDPGNLPPLPPPT